MSYPMKTIWYARDLIIRGCTVAQVAHATGMTTTSVYKYTKAERAKMKDRKVALKS